MGNPTSIVDWCCSVKYQVWQPHSFIVRAVLVGCALGLIAGETAQGARGIDAAKLPGIVVDDAAAKLEGEWVDSTASRPFVADGYKHDGNKGKGASSATFVIRVPENGYYRVLLGYTPGDNRASNVPVTVQAANGEKSIVVNQQRPPTFGSFADLGEFELMADADALVIVGNTATDGHVVIDAVQVVTLDVFKQIQAGARGAGVVRNGAVSGEGQIDQPAHEPKVQFRRVVAGKFPKLTPVKVDELLGNELGEMAQAPIVSDEIFLRRVTLDIVGRQPTLAERETYLTDSYPEKRSAVVERLLNSSDYGRNWANYWSDVIGSRQEEPELTFHDYTPFKRWLAEKLNSGAKWDEVVYAILTAQGKVGDNPAGTFIAFHQANELKLAGETTRVFLSVQVACAECHDHPFIDMPMETFHGMAAFFARTDAKIPWNDSAKIELISRDKGEHKIPGRTEEMTPIALSGINGEAAFEKDLLDLERRAKLAEWIVRPDNPYFARAYVNRIFARLLGRGFYEPVDDLGDTAEDPIFPGVHEALAKHLVATTYDHKDLVRLLVNTRAYQRTISERGSPDAKPLSAAISKKLRGDEVFDSLVTAVAIPNITPPKEKATGLIRFPVPPKSTRDLVNDAFGYDPSFKDDLLVRSMKQAMFMMNNEQLQKQIDSRPESETILAKLLNSDADDTSVSTKLYHIVLARSPSDRELGIVRAHLKRVRDRGPAFEDVLWSLLNSAEFTTRR